MGAQRDDWEWRAEAARPSEEPSPFASLPQFAGYVQSERGGQCEWCGARSAYVDGYSLPTLVFLGLHSLWRVDNVLKCPRCMRRHILIRLPLAILLANLVFPLIVVWWAVVFVRTFLVRPDPGIVGHTQDDVWRTRGWNDE